MGSLSGISHFTTSPLWSMTSPLYPNTKSGPWQPTIIQWLTAGFSPSAVQAIPNIWFAFSWWSDGITTNPRTTISPTNWFVYAIFRSL
jgi:hypothetical protein